MFNIIIPTLQKSYFICTNNSGFSYAEGYIGPEGDLYAVIPFDGVKIGISDEHDIWDMKTKLGKLENKSFEELNRYFQELKLPDTSYNEFIEEIRYKLDNPEKDWYDFKKLSNIFNSSDEIDKIFRKAYTPPILNINLITTVELNKFEDKKREVWIGGKCVAIKNKIWQSLK